MDSKSKWIKSRIIITSWIKQHSKYKSKLSIFNTRIDHSYSYSSHHSTCSKHYDNFKHHISSSHKHNLKHQYRGFKYQLNSYKHQLNNSKLKYRNRRYSNNFIRNNIKLIYSLFLISNSS